MTDADQSSLTSSDHSVHSQDNATPGCGIGPTDSLDSALLDEEENPLEGGLADNVVVPSKKLMSASEIGYNALKTHNGQLYSGMAVGGSHTWNYDPGVWKETKEEPDLWRIDYQTNKRRARNAPKGSGAPVGTEYHWLVVGHQHVRKVDANTYETHLTGAKYKLAHKSITSNSWSIPTVRGQRDREVELLEDAKRRTQGLPPVLGNEKVKVDHLEKGQQSLDNLFRQTTRKKEEAMGMKKRKRG
ncbi:hypothetical protein N7462_002145 [Penicillium macrosclerotiorum]|uniref:uncharacterized protein n=1 Tax=Penicillium macrosclerotiorum TaxID=303699 RepID=UPI00254702E0|nr:uncharacterized protein N7462_002145 [Penicillium macrosclerotiorum]KAJ5692722.1 hypothetical protein N7462_002145 [Penicillium macrosclerotiorum]